ncbi:hypothetical protein HYG86_06080 [Alkalicella caledoniensis]|uniref:Uncharacterized protein n=1 Tax=Alkalicella caledoniensis TaxID=2731377 RepID=A0A7G9W6Q9_ALKCA|nr:hypothetical protein [Alkalicella caledoniensis]QNO14371.1 hypothetical protein HYG86_06080 [Alkalicella caledoniensis]
MDSFNGLIFDEQESWVDTLPSYQKNRIKQILSSGKSPKETAILWLTASPQNTAPFGTIKGENIFLEKVEEELEGLICGDEKYDDYRKKLSSEVNLSKGYAIGLISSAIAPVVGSSGAFIAPVIALLLVGMGKIALNAWCESCKEKRNRRLEKIVGEE